MRIFLILLLCCSAWGPLHAEKEPKVTVGIDLLLKNPKYASKLKGKRIGLITNHTALNGMRKRSVDLLKEKREPLGYTLKALYAPEHGLYGSAHAAEKVSDQQDADGIPIYSLHGKTRRPTPEMLKEIDLLIFDIQDIGSRSYTYISTLFYVMEEAAKAKIPLIVADRPNPINGLMVDGPMMEEKWRSFIGYINVPYCHGMTIGELASFFNAEYKVGCSLTVVPMEGWKRSMSFDDTGLIWIPTSPNIPESTTPYYYPTTGLIGELQLLNIGVGYTLPFKLIGAPWIDAQEFAKTLNAQKFPGVFFQPFYFKPFYGRYKSENCEGVIIVITDTSLFQPIQTQYLILGILKSLYPAQFLEALEKSKECKQLFCQAAGTEEIYRILQEKKYLVWELKEVHRREREAFLPTRQKYLIPSYQ
jgi:uncharacterized protein YbbC (DUF1343 family)